MDVLVLRSFVDELSKLAALDTQETQLLREAIRRQAKFDQLSGQGKLDQAGQAEMRANVERIKAFRAKSKGEATSIPNWAKDPAGQPPPPRGRAGRPPPNSYDDFSRYREDFRSPKMFRMWSPFGAALGAGIGALGGSGIAALGLGSGTEKEKARRLEQAEKTMRPISIFNVEHPRISGALHGAAHGAVLGGLPMPINFLGSWGLDKAERAIDYGIGRKRRAEARKQKKLEGDSAQSQ